MVRSKKKKTSCCKGRCVGVKETMGESHRTGECAYVIRWVCREECVEVFENDKDALCVLMQQCSSINVCEYVKRQLNNMMCEKRGRSNCHSGDFTTA